MLTRVVFLGGILGALFGAGAVQAADPLIGLWRTEPDRKQLVSNIRIRPCGSFFCGRIEDAFNRNGDPVFTPNVGKELFWDVKALGSGAYGEGTVFVPLLNVKARASMQLKGQQLKVTGCKGPICDGQVWFRIN